MKLTHEAMKKYVKSEGANCPFCGSEDLTADEVNSGSGWMSQDVSCDDCDERWADIFTLADIEYDSSDDE